MKIFNKYSLILGMFILVFQLNIHASNKNRVPIAFNIIKTIDLNAKYKRHPIIALNAKDGDNDKLRYQIVKYPKKGRVSLRGKYVTYRPEKGFKSDYFEYIAIDTKGAKSNVARVTLKLKHVSRPPNRVPIAYDISQIYNVDSNLNHVNIILKAKDFDRDKLKYKIIAYPRNGKVILRGKKVRYYPKNGSKTDTFSYVAIDAKGAKSNVARVNLSLNQQPVSYSMSKKVNLNIPLTFNLKGSDADHDRLTYQISKNPTHGKLDRRNGLVRYTSQRDYLGSDSFIYNVKDEYNSISRPSIVRLNIVNTAPVVEDINASTIMNQPVSISLLDNDLNHNDLEYTIVSTPIAGRATISGSILRYEPRKGNPTGYHGEDTITYKSNDGISDSNIGTIKINVTPNYGDNTFGLISQPDEYIPGQPFDLVVVSRNNGTIRLQEGCGEIKPNQIVAFIRTPIRINNYAGDERICSIWHENNDGQKSEPRTLDDLRDNIVSHQLIQGRDDGKGLDLVIIGDGFTHSELSTFNQRAQELAQSIMNRNELTRLQQKAWNIHIIDLVSFESGADNTQTSEMPKVETALHSFYYGPDGGQIRVDIELTVDKVAQVVPQYDKIVVLVNSEKRAGAASGEVVFLSNDRYSDKILMHELGHSVAGLADEYYTEGINGIIINEELPSPNVSIHNDLHTIKWKHWLGEGTGDNFVDAYEGGNYNAYGVWRPTENSFMKHAYIGEFGAVNSEAWALSVYDIAGTYYSTTPQLGSITKAIRESIEFNIELSMGLKMQRVVWEVSGYGPYKINDNTSSFTFKFEEAGEYVVQATIVDKSGIIRLDEHNYSNDILTWNISVK